VTRSLGAVIPDGLAARLDGSDPAAQGGFTMLLVTTDVDGWPHVAMLSAGEVLIHGERLWMALWPRSTATERLQGSGRGLIYAIVDDEALSLRLSCRSRPGPGEGPGLTVFGCAVEEAFSDRVGYAEITSGISFELRRPERDIPRWERTIAELRRIAEATEEAGPP
jgi:hypothetical protein